MTTASTSASEGFERCRGLAPKLSRQRFGFFGGAIPDGAQQPGAMEIARHAHAHGAETNKANAHRLVPQSIGRIGQGATIVRPGA